MSLKFSIITLFCVSYQQQISSFNNFDVADLEIFFGQSFYTSEKQVKISTFNRYLFAIVAYRKQHQTYKLNVTNLWSFLHSTKQKYGNTKST